jgi:hypothetical protein
MNSYSYQLEGRNRGRCPSFLDLLEDICRCRVEAVVATNYFVFTYHTLIYDRLDSLSCSKIRSISQLLHIEIRSPAGLCRFRGFKTSVIFHRESLRHVQSRTPLTLALCSFITKMMATIESSDYGYFRFCHPATMLPWFRLFRQLKNGLIRRLMIYIRHLRLVRERLPNLVHIIVPAVQLPGLVRFLESL